MGRGPQVWTNQGTVRSFENRVAVHAERALRGFFGKNASERRARRQAKYDSGPEPRDAVRDLLRLMREEPLTEGLIDGVIDLNIVFAAQEGSP